MVRKVHYMYIGEIVHVWIKDWIPFAKKHTPMADAVYLSLGDQEEHVKNQAIARVGGATGLQSLYPCLGTG